MSIRNGWPAVSGAADQYDIRAALRATIAQDATGRIKTGAAVTSTSLTMLVTARQDMAVDLQPSDWVLDRRGPVCLSVDGVETIPLAPAPSANSRVDTVWILQRETQAPIGDNADGPLAGITTGVPGISPVAPALTDGQLAVADILIPSTATNTSSDGVVITQRAPYTTMQGGLLRFRSPTDLNLWTPVDGQRARLQDGTEYVGSGGAWVSQTRTRIYTGSKVITGTGTSEYTFLTKNDYQMIVGRPPVNGDVIVFTNGSRTAGSFTSAFASIDDNNSSVNIVFPVNVSGSRRINYAIIVQS